MKCLLIYNQRCGKQNVVKNINHIVSMLKTKFEVVDKKASFVDGETRDIARDACGRYDVIIVAGGDGTLHEVICGIGGQEKKPKIGIIPAGTINDVSRSLKISRSYKRAVNTILQGKTISHDLFRVNDEYGIYASAMGILTDISYKINSAPKRRFGKFAYYLSIPKFMFKKKTFEIDVTVNNEKFKRKCSLVLVLNSRSVAGRKVDKQNDLSDGKVNMVFFTSEKDKVGFKQLFNIVMFFGFGIRKNSKKYKIIEASNFEFHTKGSQNLNVDGERLKADTYKFEVISPGVEIFC